MSTTTYEVSNFTQTFYIYGYTLKTKYRNLMIFTNFFLPPHFWQLENPLKDQFIFEILFFNSLFGEKIPVK
jgi:hypothetical protein